MYVSSFKIRITRTSLFSLKESRIHRSKKVRSPTFSLTFVSHVKALTEIVKVFDRFRVRQSNLSKDL